MLIQKVKVIKKENGMYTCPNGTDPKKEFTIEYIKETASLIDAEIIILDN